MSRFVVQCFPIFNPKTLLNNNLELYTIFFFFFSRKKKKKLLSTVALLFLQVHLNLCILNYTIVLSFLESTDAIFVVHVKAL